MPCMGPDYSHAEPMADRMTATIVKVLAEHGIAKPLPSDYFTKRLSRQWRDAENDLRNAIRHLIEVDASANF